MSLIDSTSSIIRTYKRAVGNPSYVWSNTYEITWIYGIVPDTSLKWRELLAGWLEAEYQLHTSNVEFIKAVGSTWSPLTPEQGTYDPADFYVYLPDTPDVGTRTITGDPLPRHCALYVKKEVEFGHTGKLFYRGCLGEGDIQSTNALDLRIPTATLASIQQIVTAMVSDWAVLLDAYMGTHALLRQLPGEGGIETRVVQDFKAAGLSINQPNHAYYDRS